MIRTQTTPRLLAAVILGLAPLCCSIGTASAAPPIIPIPGDPDSPVINRRNDTRSQEDFGGASGNASPQNSGSLHISVQTADPLLSNEHPIITR